MANVIKLRKGLNINLKGKAARQKFSSGKCAQYALVPDDFVGMTPKVVVREGDKVKVGDALFVNKKQQTVKYLASVSLSSKERNYDLDIHEDLCGCGDLQDGT